MASGVLRCLGYHWDREYFWDFIVQVEEREFKCHRFMLGSCSDFFSGLLRSDMKENASDKATVKDISSEIFELILDALYKGRNIVTSENVFEVWHAANQLQILFLLKACEEFIMGNITVDNFMEIHKNANQLNSDRVLKAVMEMMIHQFDKIMRSSDLFDVSFNDLLAVVGSEDVNVCTNSLVQAIMAWVTTSFPETVVELKKEDFSGNINVPIKRSTGVKERLKHLNTLLEAIKLERVTDCLLGQLINNETVLACHTTTKTVANIVQQRLNGRGRNNNCFGPGGKAAYCSRDSRQHGGECPLHQSQKRTSQGYTFF